MCRSWVRRWRAVPVRRRWPRRCPTQADSAFWPAAISAPSAWPTTSWPHAQRPPARSASTCSCPSPAWPTSSRWTITPRRSTSWPSTTTSKSAIQQFGDDDGWRQKLEVVADLRPELVSFTFGAPSPDVLRWFGALGMLLYVTVTSTYEAGVAVAAGADGLVVQGPNAGGHRGTFAPDMEPGTSR